MTTAPMTAEALKIVAVLDEGVLYPPSLRNLLLWLATVRAYEARWTEEIHAEWTRNVLADHPDVTPAQLDRTRRLMSVAVPKGLVSGYEARIPTLSLPDANDCHVLAAAIEAGAAVSVTFNLSDFPAAALGAYGIEPLHPDVFLSALFDGDTALFLQGVQQHRASLHNPPKTAADYISLRPRRGPPQAALPPIPPGPRRAGVPGGSRGSERKAQLLSHRPESYGPAGDGPRCPPDGAAAQRPTW